MDKNVYQERYEAYRLAVEDYLNIRPENEGETNGLYSISQAWTKL